MRSEEELRCAQVEVLLAAGWTVREAEALLLLAAALRAEEQAE